MTTILQPVGGALRSRPLLLGLAVARTALAALGALLAPLLWRDHFTLLVLLRPTKEVLLAAGFLVREGRVSAPVVAMVAVPLVLFGVWLFYGLGRAYADRLHDDDLPGLAGRVLPAKRIRQLSRILDREGPKVVFLGRLAVFPSALMAAAAGAAGMKLRPFLIADALGAVASVALVAGAGFALGEAYERGGPWLTGLGAVIGAALLVQVGRRLRSEPDSGA